MAEKLLAVLQILRDHGWSAYAYGDLKGWGIFIQYIDEGPEFNYLVRLDPIAWSPYYTITQLAQVVMSEALDAMEVRNGNANQIC